MRSWRPLLPALVAAVVLFGPVREAFSQTTSTGSITGIVKDTTGAVLPGVTVEASSPALIEKVRSVVTNAEGLYRIESLRPGTYKVTFTLPGFATVQREGLELVVGLAARADAELRVGAVEETITVSGTSPVVDTRTVRSQALVSREQLDVLPTGKNVSGLSAIT